MDSLDQTLIDALKHNHIEHAAKTESNNLFQLGVELGRFLQDIKHIDDTTQNDSIRDKVTVIEWLKKMKASAKALRIDSVKISQLEQLLIKAGVVS
jgi:hypothetical protein